MIPILSALPFPDIDPVLLRIGPLAIHWYGVAYVVSILLGWWYAKRLVANTRLWPNDTPPMRDEDLDDFLVWAALGIVLGGRIGYILFYDIEAYLADPLRIFAIWEGGMSFHGGLLGVILAILIFCRRRGISTAGMIDTLSPVAPIGIGLVRLANFVNSELWGRPTDVPWAMVFPNGGPELRHPSQLYEAALEGFVLFVVLRILTHHLFRLKKPLFLGGAFFAGYGVARIFVEFFRVPDAQIGYLLGGWLTMGMILSLPLVIIGVGAMIWASRQKALPAQ